MFWLPENVAFFHSQLLLNNSANFKIIKNETVKNVKLDM